jgi:hypothetical protein
MSLIELLVKVLYFFFLKLCLVLDSSLTLFSNQTNDNFNGI